MDSVMVVDRRVGPKKGGSHDLVEPLRKYGVNAEQGDLDFADVCFVGNNGTGPVEVGIEVKTVADLLGSIITKRLIGHQVPGMVRDYQIRYLIIQGLMRPAKDGLLEIWRGSWMPSQPHMTYSALNRMLITLEQMAGFRIRNTQNQRETVQTISDIYRWWQKPWKKHKAHLDFDHSRDVPPDRSLLEKPTLLEKMVGKIDSIGWRKSKRVAERFETVQCMANAFIEEWMEIEGIGKKTATDIVKAIRGE